MNTETCINCLYGRIDNIGKIYCAKFGGNFQINNTCKLWNSKDDNCQYTKSNPGYVYILSNPDLSGLLKIGMTSKIPEVRAKELSGTTGVSSKYQIEYYGRVEDRFLAEKAAHNRLENFHHKKEFFKVDIGVAIYCVETISCPIEREYIKPGNDQKVLNYAQERDQIPYKQLEKEWKEREKDRRRYTAEQAKMKNWEKMVEDYMRKKTDKEEPLFNYNKLPGNPHVKKNVTEQFKEDYNPNKVVLPSELARAEHQANKAQEDLKKKEREIDKLKKELADEKNKGFFKRLFS
jgi:hypothetical protein